MSEQSPSEVDAYADVSVNDPVVSLLAEFGVELDYRGDPVARSALVPVWALAVGQACLAASPLMKAEDLRALVEAVQGSEELRRTAVGAYRVGLRGLFLFLTLADEADRPKSFFTGDVT